MTFAVLWLLLPLIVIATFVLSIFGSTRTRFVAGLGTLVFLIGYGMRQLPRLLPTGGDLDLFFLASALVETLGIGLLALAAILPPPRSTSTGYGTPPPVRYPALQDPVGPSQHPQTPEQRPSAPSRYDHLPRAGEAPHGRPATRPDPL